MPDQFPFSTEIIIRITDLNYGGHVGNDTFLSLAQEARHRYLQSLGYSELEFENTSLIMSDAAIEFKNELRQDDKIRISVVAAGFTKYGFDLFYLFEIIADSETKTAAKIKTGMLCFDYTSKKLSLLPAAAKEKMEVAG